MNTSRNLFQFARRTLGWASIAALLFGLAAPGAFAQSPSGSMSPAEWEKVVAAAKKEGKVQIYSIALPSVNARLAADFEKAYPDLKVEFTRLIGFDLTSRVEQERLSGADGADAVINTDVLWFDRSAKANLLTVPKGPAAANWPAKFLIAGTAPILAMEPYSIAYNTNLVKTPITGYADLVKPGTDFKMATLGPVAPIVLAWYDWLDQTQGPNFLKDLAARKPNIYNSNAATTQAAASGEVAVAISSNPASSSVLIAQGAPLKVVVPNPTMGIVYGFGVVTWSKHPNAALVLMDYLMSPRGQTVWSGLGESASPLKNIPGSLDIDTISPWDAAKYTPEVIKAATQKFNTQFKGQ